VSHAEVLVVGAFDNLGLRHVRFLQEASRAGPVAVLLWADHVVSALLGGGPKFLWEARR